MKQESSSPGPGGRGETGLGHEGKMTRLPCGGQVGHPPACTSTPRCCAGLHGLSGPEERVLRELAGQTHSLRSDTSTFWEREGLHALGLGQLHRSLCQAPPLLPCARCTWGVNRPQWKPFFSGMSKSLPEGLAPSHTQVFLMECSGVQERPQAWQTQSQMIAVDSL